MGARLTGMMISHTDGSVGVLGQWDYSQCSSICEIYNRRNGVLTSLGFHMLGKSPNASYVAKISVGTDQSRSSNHLSFNCEVRLFTIANLNPPMLMWWSTRSFDHIELWSPWIGEFEQIDVSNHSYNRMDLI